MRVIDTIARGFWPPAPALNWVFFDHQTVNSKIVPAQCHNRSFTEAFFGVKRLFSKFPDQPLPTEIAKFPPTSPARIYRHSGSVDF
jgi:hypothetical protein